MRTTAAVNRPVRRRNAIRDLQAIACHITVAPVDSLVTGGC
jgi:hypothetical protein